MIHIKYFFFAIIFFLTVNSFSQNAKTLEFQSNEGDDAVVWRFFGSNQRFGNVQIKNYGDYKFLKVLAWTWDGIPGVTQAYIKFKLPELENAKILSAKLSLFGATNESEKHSQLSGDNDFVISRILEDWNQDDITWENKPEISDQNSVTVKGSDSTNFDFIDIDVTKLLTDMYSNADNSFGFNISLKSKQYYRMLVFSSFEFDELSKRPKLEIEYVNEKASKFKNHKQISKSNKKQSDSYTLIVYDNQGNEVERIENINIKKKSKVKSGIFNFSLIKDENVKASGKAIIY